jgi:iron-sulfur cluster assembly protein
MTEATLQNSTEEEMIIRLSEKAIHEVKRVLSEDKRPGIGLRLGVKGGGCSGLSYVIDYGTKRENDHVDTRFGFDIFIDPKSGLYLKDTVLDFQGGFMGRGFKFENPNASNTCGCGESFSV